MKILKKQYISYLGYDYTQYVETEEDVKTFNKLCEAEKKTKGIPLRECVHDVALVLNLDAKIRGRRPRAHVQGNAGDN